MFSLGSWNGLGDGASSISKENMRCIGGVACSICFENGVVYATEAAALHGFLKLSVA
jgi:hypothetical protein